MDIIDKVVKLPVFDANSSIPKLRLELRNGNYEQTVYLLGEHACRTRNAKADVHPVVGA